MPGAFAAAERTDTIRQQPHFPQQTEHRCSSNSVPDNMRTTDAPMKAALTSVRSGSGGGRDADGNQNEPECCILHEPIAPTGTQVTQHANALNGNHVTVSHQQHHDVSVDEFLKLISSLVPNNNHEVHNNNNLRSHQDTTTASQSNLCGAGKPVHVTSLHDEEPDAAFVDSEDEDDHDMEDDDEEPATNHQINNINSSATAIAKIDRDAVIQQTLEYCPNYFAFDRRARKESKERISSHLQERQRLVIKCIEAAAQEIVRLGLPFVRGVTPTFEDNGEILQAALLQLDKQIGRWDGVQVRQCKKEQRDGTKIIIDSWQKFAKKAKNHQDQTSWRISGDYFFAPYIKKIKQFLVRFCDAIDGNLAPDMRHEVVDFGCISFALFLLSGKIKFHRTKLKPLIRHRTLVKSSGIQTELQNLYPQLTLQKFIQNAKQSRKKNDGKNTVIASAFYQRVLAFARQLYQQQRHTVMQSVMQHQHSSNQAVQAAARMSIPPPVVAPSPQQQAPPIENTAIALVMPPPPMHHPQAAQPPKLVPPFPQLPLLPIVNDISISSSSRSDSLSGATPIPELPAVPLALGRFSWSFPDFAPATATASPATPQKRKPPDMLHSSSSPNGRDKPSLKKRRTMNGVVADERREEEAEECKQQHQVVKSEFDDHDESDGGNMMNQKIELAYVLSSCDGSCGNQIGRWIAGLIHGQALLTQQQMLDVIAHKFGQFGNKMRALLIEWISSSVADYRSDAYALCATLQNEHVCISHNLSADGKWIAIFGQAFTHLLQSPSKQSHVDVVQRLLRQSCKRCDLELLEEVEQNLAANSANHVRFNFNQCQRHIAAVKNTAMYTRLKLQGMGLTNNEIIAVFFYYTYACILEEFANAGNRCKWKVLFAHLCAAIRKMYHALIYRVEQTKYLLPQQLYHLMIVQNSSNGNHTRYPMRPRHNHPLALHTISVAYCDVNHMSNICSFNQNDCAYLMTLCDVQNALFSGRVIAAPVDWLLECSDHCADTRWLLLPTSFERAQFQNERENISSWKIFPSLH